MGGIFTCLHRQSAEHGTHHFHGNSQSAPNPRSVYDSTVFYIWPSHRSQATAGDKVDQWPERRRSLPDSSDAHERIAPGAWSRVRFDLLFADIQFAYFCDASAASDHVGRKAPRTSLVTVQSHAGSEAYG
ncbi:hypothetical protein D9613_007532 [Agrocybe pediades]|uniref:Uncharacterized protein n=1 Tax=Agrocybe pediades TaxID=84607 RepID=A0A8H4QN20_9AGAR|nr:hypothetical protein D9613_007532 [Agrocybe pediades]